ncbi:M81 family metallopeptidase [Roseovarius aquimarinus]|uniref:M81 family metallopeptidase n=1 Tax=Roseovarius aquimarinus TaxID=1229156 RepID=A0ABW7I634_9RHOB
MSGGAPRILVGQIFHEANSFNARLTTEVDFAIHRGAELITQATGTGTTLGGILDALGAAGATIIPALSACASPGGPVAEPLWQAMLAEMQEAARQAAPNAIVLDLHGAMVSEKTDDPEGTLLTALREIVGPDVPIAVGLDLHAHVTDAMCESADILVACKNNPHDDYFDAGQRAARLCLDALAGRIAPVLTRLRLPMILFGNDETTSGPLRDLNAVARRREAEGALDVSIHTVQAMLDVPDMAQVITVMTDSAPDTGAAICTELGAALLARAAEFRTDHLPLDALWPLLGSPEAGPYAVSDFGDRVLAGAAGDSVEVLRAALRRDGIRAAIPVTDPAAARSLRAHAPGETVRLSLGGAFSGAAPLALEARVLRHHDGRFTLAGPWLGGARGDHGKTTVLELGGLRVIVTERPALSQDVNFFRALGIEIEPLHFVLCKSGFHFKLSFEGIAAPLILGTNGPGRYDPARKGLRRAPLWPEGPALPPLGAPRHFG